MGLWVVQRPRRFSGRLSLQISLPQPEVLVPPPHMGNRVPHIMLSRLSIHNLNKE
jgi:hypothetical protein